MTTWHNVKTDGPPKMSQENPYDKWTSKPVLALTRWGTMLVATLELWEETDSPEWFSNCSEHWSMGDAITHWIELPEPPKQ
jgi:hypothetical protein